MTILHTTPFRAIGDVPFVTWHKTWQAAQSFASSPSELDAEAMYDACRGYTAMALVQAIKESSLGKDESARVSRNPLGLMDASGSKLKRFMDWSEAFGEFRWRITDPGYKGGVYYKGGKGIVPGYDMSLLAYIVTYVGGPGCLSSNGATCANGERYDPTYPKDGASVLGDINAPSINFYCAQTLQRLRLYLGETEPPPPPPTTDLVFGRVPSPRIVNRVIPSYGSANNGAWVPVGYNSAWNNLGGRGFRGFCIHVMEGHLDGTDAYFRNQARQSALTDFGIGCDGWEGQYGELYQWNTKASGRAPWANGSGGAGGEEEDGPAFINKYSINAVNRDLRSIELSGYAGKVMPERQFTLLIELMAYVADQEKIPYTTWPILNGLPLVYGHYEFSTKPCPGSVVRGRIPEIIERVGKRLRQYQEAT